MNFKKFALPLTLPFLLLSVLPALAGSAYKQARVEYLDSGASVPLNTIAITGFGPYQYVKVGLGTLVKSAKTSCNGYLRVDLVPLPSKPTALSVDGTSYTVASAPTQLLKCGVSDSFPQGQLFNQAGSAILSGPTFFKSGLDGRYYIKTNASSGGIPKDVVYVGVNNDRAVRADACGMLTLRDSKAAPWTANTSIVVGASTYTVGSISSGDALPKCTRVGQAYQLFMPN